MDALLVEMSQQKHTLDHVQNGCDSYSLPHPLPQIPNCDNAYCKFEVVAGEDWQLLDGMEGGITQVAALCKDAWTVEMQSSGVGLD